MGKLTKQIDYESLRNARILENQARLASIGLEKTISDLRSVATSAKPVKKYCKKVYDVSSLRRSSRLSKPGVGGEESYFSEDLEEVRENKEWKCPHCIEEKGVKPYWIFSSLCLKKRKMAPTGWQYTKMGYKSLAHLLMDKLQRADKH